MEVQLTEGIPFFGLMEYGEILCYLEEDEFDEISKNGMEPTIKIVFYQPH